MRLIKTLLLLALIPTSSYAFFCPTNFNQIDFGESIDQVEQQCGKPDKVDKKDEDAPTPQEWTYYVPQTVAINTSQTGQGTLKTSVAFDKDGKAINISVNGLGVGATTICGKSIQLGNTEDEIKAACGTPAATVKQSTDNASDTSTPPKKIVIDTYNSSPPQKLTFEDGKLVSKE